MSFGPPASRKVIRLWRHAAGQFYVRKRFMPDSGADKVPGRFSRDVRMRGFAERSTVEAAWDWVERSTPRFDELPTELVAVSAAAGRVVAGDIISDCSVPGFDRAMMDGFAVRAEETFGASAYNPLSMNVIGCSLPGNPYSGTVGAGQAVRIMTGAPMPDGSDAVLPVEQTENDGEHLTAVGEVTEGKHVGRVGEDVRAGDCVLMSQRRLRPQDIGVLTAIGIREICVIRPPVVRIVVTGNELLPAGTRPSGHRIADSNGPMLAALTNRDGGQVVSDGIVPDTAADILQALQQPADVILVSGGSSVGQEDFVPMLLAKHGELAIHGVAMRPSSPTGMGRFGRSFVFLLPGNPVSCLCAYDFFAGRAVRVLAGRPCDWPYSMTRLPLSRKLVSTVGRVDYARVRVIDGAVEPLAIGGASVLSSTTRADGFVIVPADSEGYAPGTQVDVRFYS